MKALNKYENLSNEEFLHTISEVIEKSGGSMTSENFFLDYCRNISIVVEGTDKLHETHVEKILFDAFGPCNPIMPSIYKWEWVLRSDKFIFTISAGFVSRWHITVLGSKEKHEIDESWKTVSVAASEIYQAIELEAKKSKISESKLKSNKLGGIIKNPYAIFLNTSHDLLNTADKLNQQDSEMWIISSLLRSAFITNLLAMEGFINMVFEIFLKWRYKNELYEKKSNEEIFLKKILDIDRYCDHFTRQPLTVNEDLFKALSYLRDIRNDILHANIVKGMRHHLLSDDPKEFFVKEIESGNKYGITRSFLKITNHDVILARRIVSKIVSKIIGALEEEQKIPFAIVHTDEEIQFRNKEGVQIVDDDYSDKEHLIFDIDKFRAEREEKIGDAFYVIEQSTQLDQEFYTINQNKYPNEID